MVPGMKQRFTKTSAALFINSHSEEGHRLLQTNLRFKVQAKRDFYMNQLLITLLCYVGADPNCISLSICAWTAMVFTYR